MALAERRGGRTDGNYVSALRSPCRATDDRQRVPCQQVLQPPALPAAIVRNAPSRKAPGSAVMKLACAILYAIIGMTAMMLPAKNHLSRRLSSRRRTKVSFQIRTARMPKLINNAPRTDAAHPMPSQAP